MSGGGKKEKKSSSSSSSSSSLESEVDQLLKAAEDHVLLNLKLNSHTKSSSTATHNLLSSSSSYLDPDLTRRFEALKTTPTKPESVDVDHLSARFDALKSSLGRQEVLDFSSNVQESDGGGGDDEDDDGVSQKEVEKLMRWAMDAARLESASKTKDEIDDDDEDKEEEDDDDDEDSEEERKKKESNSEGKGKPKKWYFF